ncbi:MAG TPA: hypothetical protein VMT51_06260 [Dongiaceae bacterium]|nr:hypothetical protein [Dongiaceae bacterium]
MSKRTVLAALVMLILCCAARVSRAGGPPSAFDRLKTLVGEWDASTGKGHTRVTYTLTSGGSALMERLKPDNEPEMITMYTKEGDHILVTHYCSAGNQPQMKTGALKDDVKKYSFTLLRVNGMQESHEGHMTGLVLTLQDPDHVTQTWTFEGKDGKASSEVFELKRKAEKPVTIPASGN